MNTHQEKNREDALELIEELQNKIYEAAELYRELERTGYSDHYIKQELLESYMDSLPEKLDRFKEEITCGDEE